MACLEMVAIAILMALCNAQDTGVTVQSQAGTFIGFKEDIDLGDRNVTIEKFLGIPYAEPPVGDLRFRKSVMKAPLTEPLQVKKFGSACLQFYFLASGDNDSEDCLFLNIVRPIVEEEGAALPVMLWIYGGGFILGSANPYIGDALAAHGPVIVVTFNYRVSLWGFLSTGDSNARGNYGLWDQHMAIKWVHQNIGAFGGDPDRVTVFGQSAGAGSGVFQGLFPGNKGLFQRIIAQSGSAASQWATTAKAKEEANQLASLVDCDTTNTQVMVDCLRAAPVEKLNATLNNMSNWQVSIPMHFVPVVDGEFVQTLPSDVLDKTGQTRPDLRQLFASFDLMTGVVSGEGGAAVNPFTGVDTDPENFLPNKTFFDETLVTTLTKLMYGDDVPDIVNKAIIAEYTSWDDPENPENIRQQFVDMHGDNTIIGAVYRTLNAHASLSQGRTYQYSFNLVPYQGIFPRATWVNKPMHGDEIPFHFDNMFVMEGPGLTGKRDFQDWEKRAARNIMTLWTNFAATGNPNKPRDLGLDWLPYTPKNHRYLEIVNEVSASKVKERLQEKRAIFWDGFVPSLIAAAKDCNQDSDQGTCSQDKGCVP